jgi:penicillin amidase
MRFLTKALALIVILAIVASGAAYFYARRSMPDLTGAIQVDGISAPVDIIRDTDAVPHVFASTKLDGLYGLGYVHAQDRLWQMEFQRRLGFGRLSEIFGSATLPQDRFLRTVGFGRAAREAWARLPSPTKAQVEAYVAGVNAFVATHRGRGLPPEFALLGFEPEPWDGADVVVWQKMVAWDLSANYSLELLRHDILGRVGLERLAELMPPYAIGGLSILGLSSAEATRTHGLNAEGFRNRSATPGTAPAAGKDVSWTGALSASLSDGLPTVRDLLLGGSATESLGSNNWVVDGTLTATGLPLLANDPHLTARLPSIWYLAHVSAGDYDAIGATFPGTPAIILGRNRFVAWGATNVAADVEDLFLEKLDPTGKFAEFQGAQEALQVIPETIRIKGREPMKIDVRLSRHGPLVSDPINTNNAASQTPARRALTPLEPLAFRWTALDPDDTTLVAMMRISEVRDWADFTAALGDFVVPSQNFVYADVAGHIGYYAPGRIPIRARGDGQLPANGWTGEAEWIGWVPFDKLPRAYDPPEHAIITANQRPMPPSYKHLLGVDWPESYRAQRIADLLRGKTKLTADDFSAIQADTVSLHARTMLPVLLEHARPNGAADALAVRMLRQWNYDARGDSAPAAIFAAWFLRLAPALLTDQLGQLTTESYQGRFSFVTRFLLQTLTSPDSGSSGIEDEPSVAGRSVASRATSGPGKSRSDFWCDDSRTAEKETCELIVTKALNEAIEDLTRRLGNDMPRWRWDAVHRAKFPHQGLDRILGILFSRSVPSAGDWSTIAVGTVSTDSPYDQLSVASYRQIIDLSPANDSRFIDAVGQSGHPQSRHYDDFLEDWRTLKHRPMRMERAEVERGAVGKLRLVPKSMVGDGLQAVPRAGLKTRPYRFPSLNAYRSGLKPAA